MNKIKFSAVGILAVTLCACNNGSSSATPALVSNDNSVTLEVNGGYNNQARNRAFITVTICQPNSPSTCQTIDNIVVDTGSTGLRVNKSALTIPLPITQYNAESVFQCMQYGGGYDFGPAATATVQIGSEVATNIPIQIMDNGNQDNVPSNCTRGVEFNDFEDYGANGIIGVNPFSNPDNTYTSGGVYTCTSSSYCTQVDPNAISEVLNINPVVAFPVDNNGLIFSIPAVPTSTGSVTGTLIFGLNTKPNNIIPDNVTAVLGSPSNSSQVGGFQSITESVSSTSLAIFDSGTPTLSFYSPYFALCSGNFSIFYCPIISPQSWLSTVANYNGGTTYTLSNSIVNYSSDFNNLQSVIPSLGEFAQQSENLTIYGLPFFYGKNTYVGFMGKSTAPITTSLGTGPTWGYLNN